MKKLLITAATLAMFAVPSFAQDQNRSETEKMRFEMRMEFMRMTDQMIEDEIATSQMQMKRLTAYQRILKKMMENESNN